MSKTGSRSNPRIFSMIAKISLGLRKFRNHRENFAILVKFTVDSEISHFLYLCRISIG